MSDLTSRYVMPGTFIGRTVGRFFNTVVAGLTKAGVSLYGSRVLYVRGRTSGEWRTTPVNPLTFPAAATWSLPGVTPSGSTT